MNNLYVIEKKDFIKTGNVFGSAFKDDPSFHDIFKDIDCTKRDAFFEGPARYCHKYGKVYASSQYIEGLAAWVHGEYADMTTWRVLRSGLVKSTSRVGMKTLLFMKEAFEPLEKARRTQMQDIKYLYLMALGVDPMFQGRGFGSKLLKAVIEDSNDKSLPIYLETATQNNVDMYENFGFKVIDRLDLPLLNIPQWSMVREYNAT